MRSLLVLALLVGLTVTCHGVSAQGIRNGMEDSLLTELATHKMMVIPECLSHDSYDAVQLPVRLIKRWLEKYHGIHRLVIGLESETDSRKYALIDSGRYDEYERFATICPGGWGLFSTRELNLGLFFKDVREKVPDRFSIFGYENSYHYYDPVRAKYLLPTQVDTVRGVQKIPYTESKAPMALQYAYARFFRDWMAFTTVRQAVVANPDACFLIITGNAHTLRVKHWDDTDHQIADGYSIDTVKYSRWLGGYLNETYHPLFVQSDLDSVVSTPTLFHFDPKGPDSVRFKGFFCDDYFLIPNGPEANLEEPPFLCIPSARNLELLEHKLFQLYPDSVYHALAQRIVYFLTGIKAEVVEDQPGASGSATFHDPQTRKPLDYDKLKPQIIACYANGSYIARLREDPSAYNHRSLFKGIFRMMGKKDFSSLSDVEATQFTDYLLAALSVIGTPEERRMARTDLARRYGQSADPYFYYKRFYFGQYQ